MAVTEKKIQFENANSNQIEISVPIFGYKSEILFPFDIQEDSNTQYHIFDNGSSYDIRKFSCELLLTATEMNTLNDFISGSGVTKGRAQELTMRMNDTSGLFPFAPDKGDEGNFTTAIEIENTGMVLSPYKYFKCNLNVINTGAWPSYSLPSEFTEGQLTIGTITGNRFPPDGFKASNSYGYNITVEQDSSVQFIDKGSGADKYITEFTMISNESKTAKVIEYLTGTARAGAFNITTQSGYYPFGRDKGDGTFSVRLIRDVIVIEHIGHEQFSYNLSLSYISGP